MVGVPMFTDIYPINSDLAELTDNAAVRVALSTGMQTFSDISLRFVNCVLIWEVRVRSEWLSEHLSFIYSKLDIKCSTQWLPLKVLPPHCYIVYLMFSYLIKKHEVYHRTNSVFVHSKHSNLPVNLCIWRRKEDW